MSKTKRIVVFVLLIVCLLFMGACEVQLPNLKLPTPKCCIVGDTYTGEVIGCSSTEKDNAECSSHYFDTGIGNTQLITGQNCNEIPSCTALTNCFGYYADYALPYNVPNENYMCHPDLSTNYYCEAGNLTKYQYCGENSCNSATGLCGMESMDPINQGLVFYMNFNQNPPKDLSGNENNGIVYTAVYKQGEGMDKGDAGATYYYDGASDYIEIEDSPVLSLSPDFTIAFWMKRDDTTSIDSIIGKGSASPNIEYRILCNSGATGKIQIMLGNTIGTVWSTTWIPNYICPISVWTHIAVSRTGGNNLTLYVNGIPIESKTIALITPPDGIHKMRIGDDLGASHWWKGNIDNVRIYNYALDQTKIQDIINYENCQFTCCKNDDCNTNLKCINPRTESSICESCSIACYPSCNAQSTCIAQSPHCENTCCVRCSNNADCGGQNCINAGKCSSYCSAGDVNLQLNYKFEDPITDGWVTDSSTYNRKGNIFKTPKIVKGIVGNGIKFNNGYSGTGVLNDHIEVFEYKGVTGQTPRTVMFWYKSNDNSASPQNLISWGSATEGNRYDIMTNNIKHIKLVVGTSNIYGTTTDLIDLNWHHIAITFPEGSTKLGQHLIYIDGILEPTTPASNTVINTDSSAFLTIGQSKFNDFYQANGIMDELKIYNRALSQAEINAIKDEEYSHYTRSTWVVYSRYGPASGNAEIYVNDTDNLFYTKTLCTATGHQKNPRIDGNYVVWQDERGGSANPAIYRYNLLQETETKISPEGVDQILPDISGDVVVVVDKRDGLYEIYSYNFSTGIETRLTNNEFEDDNPHISGDVVVYSCDNEICIYDLSDLRETKITNNPSITYSMHDISGDVVVYVDTLNGDIYLYNITTQETIQINNGPGQNDDIPKIDGNYLVFERDSGTINDLIYKNLTTGEEIIADSSTMRIYPIDIYDNKIFYTINNAIGDNWAVYLYDISTGEKTTIGSSFFAYGSIG